MNDIVQNIKRRLSVCFARRPFRTPVTARNCSGKVAEVVNKMANEAGETESGEKEDCK